MEFVPQSIKWLIPDEVSPCDIYLHFRGQYAIAVPVGEMLSMPTLTKLAKAGYAHVYIKTDHLTDWKNYTAKRHPAPTAASPKTQEKTAAEGKSLYGNKRAELQSYVLKTIVPKDSGDKESSAAFEEANEALNRVMKSTMLDWYFQQFHEPPDLLNHTGRVAYSTAVFSELHKVASPKELDTVIFSALIHELEGNPSQSMGKLVVSQATLAILEKSKRPVPQEVIEMIRMHDELSSGQGFPNKKKHEEIPVGVRAFILFNHFDHYRLASTGTRRARYDRVKQLMTARKQDYDPKLFGLFWDFWEKKAENMG